MGQPEATKVVIPNDTAKAHALQAAMVDAARDAGFTNEDCFAIQLALDEALSNAIHHGNCDDPDKQVHVSYRVTPRRFEVSICDEGCGFKPDDLPDPTAEENLTRPHGRGVMLMKAYMHEVSYTRRGRCVNLARIKDAPTPSA